MINKATGKITQIMGAVIDVQFTGELPAIMSALTVDNNGKARHIAQDVYRTIGVALQKKFRWRQQKILLDSLRHRYP